MYWCKRKTLLVFIAAVFIAGLYSCRPDVKNKAAARYFDLKGFFEKDSARLARLNKPVLKTISHNDVDETKRVTIANWGTELSLFKASDINKPAWRDSYSILGDSDLIIYKAKTPDLKTREIMIRKSAGKVISIMVLNHAKNMLYETREKLTYFPDSLYLIEKWQAVRVLGINRYRIKGFFNQ